MDYGCGGSEPVEPSLAHNAATSSSDDDNDDKGSGDVNDSVEGGSATMIELRTVIRQNLQVHKKKTPKRKTKCYSVGCLSVRLIRRKKK